MPIGVPKVEYRLPGEPEADWIDLYNCLYRERMLFLCQDLGDEVANQLISLMLYLNAEDPSQPFFMYINSLGGSVTCGIGVYDIMRYLESGITTICMGTASSMASFVLAGGTYGRRLSLPHGRIMIHQPEGGSDGQASEILSESSEVNRIRQQIGLIYANRTQQSIERIARDMDRDQFMSADEAKSYGLIDFVARTATDSGVDVEMLKLLTNSPSTPKPFRDLASARSMEEAQQVIRNLPEPPPSVVDDFKTLLFTLNESSDFGVEFGNKVAVLGESAGGNTPRGSEVRDIGVAGDMITRWSSINDFKTINPGPTNPSLGLVSSDQLYMPDFLPTMADGAVVQSGSTIGGDLTPIVLDAMSTGTKFVERPNVFDDPRLASAATGTKESDYGVSPLDAQRGNGPFKGGPQENVQESVQEPLVKT